MAESNWEKSVNYCYLVYLFENGSWFENGWYKVQDPVRAIKEGVPAPVWKDS